MGYRNGGNRRKNRKPGRRAKASHEADAAELARRFAVLEGDAVVCGKKAYWDRGRATQAIGRTAKTNSGGRQGINGWDGEHRLNVYRCDVCPGRPWHIGHRPSRLG